MMMYQTYNALHAQKRILFRQKRSRKEVSEAREGEGEEGRERGETHAWLRFGACGCLMVLASNTAVTIPFDTIQFVTLVEAAEYNYYDA